MGDSKRFITAQISDETHQALMRLATSHGRHPSDLVEEYVERGLEEDRAIAIDQDQELPIEVETFAMYYQTKKKSSASFQLKQIALSLIRDPDEDRAAQFDRLCARNGFITERIMEQAQEDAVSYGSSITFSTDDNVERAKQFLLNLIPAGEEMPANDIYAAGAREIPPIGKPVLRQAKTELGIQTSRRPRWWVWERMMTISIPKTVDVRGNNGSRK